MRLDFHIQVVIANIILIFMTMNIQFGYEKSLPL